MQQIRIDNRLPTKLDMCPTIIPPTKAPMLATQLVTVDLLEEKTYSSESLCIRQAKSKDENHDRNATTQQVQTLPSHLDVVGNGSGEDNSQKVSESVTLLQKTRNESSGLDRTVVQSGSGSISVNTTQHDTENGTNTQELFVSGHTVGTKLNASHQQDVETQRPFSSVSVTEVTKHDTTNRSQHEHQGDTPGDLLDVLTEVMGKCSSIERHREEIVRVPSPCHEGRGEHNPLTSRDQSKTWQWVQQVSVGPHHGLGRNKVCDSCFSIVRDRSERKAHRTDDFSVQVDAFVVFLFDRHGFLVAHL
ncbi:hypothetical protein OGAPHI_005387 [Ogataea philodendri]|uniref:Uncharacterized protein n=1 Tax=Ogataea philodendri TaxID=1378263 RepID=A0A9P8P1E4_9ASCO|nr:uncharacterized protein OGAPHI_005387 [Ogataea philodendri]KAH3663397.1 hypothetical protein OGAPHI_005387 [Ogataea philodendri]